MLQSTQATTAMVSGGTYSQTTRGAKDVIDNATPLVLEAVRRVPAPKVGQAFRVADYGAADGGTSQAMWHTVCRAIRDRLADTQIVVNYTDLPSNDFSALFKLMQGIDGDPTEAYQRLMHGVFVLAAGTGFHRQIFPDHSIHAGFSATAMHYISEKPCEIPNHVHMVGAAVDEREAFAAQARTDWERILLARAAELVPGARLVVVNFCIDDQGRYLGNTGGVNMFDTFHEHWKAMRDEDMITQEEYVAGTFSQYYRTKDEYCAPLLEAGPVRNAGLKLVDAYTRVYPCPYRRAFEASNGAMSPTEFAANYVPTLRSWSETVFKTALAGRPPSEQTKLVNNFYRRYQKQVAADPTGHAMDYVHCYMVIEKSR